MDSDGFGTRAALRSGTRKPLSARGTSETVQNRFSSREIAEQSCQVPQVDRATVEDPILILYIIQYDIYIYISKQTRSKIT